MKNFIIKVIIVGLMLNLSVFFGFKMHQLNQQDIRADIRSELVLEAKAKGKRLIKLSEVRGDSVETQNQLLRAYMYKLAME